MKRFLCFVITFILILGMCACGGEKANPNALQAGFARVDCLPDDSKVHIAGGDAASDVSAGVLDMIAVTCIALKQGEQTYLIYTCDVVDIEKFYIDTEVAIATATEVPSTHILLNATHTHSAPTLKDNLPGKDAYLAKFNAACADAGVKAIEDLSPATLSYGSVQTQNMVRVRHYLMKDGTSYGGGHGSTTGTEIQEHHYPSDEECQVLRLTRPAEDKKDIVLMNLGAHATIVSATHTDLLSPDFPGPARDYVEENADVHCAYFIAAAGDQTPSSKIPGEIPNGRDHVAYGQQLGAYVVDCLGNMTDATGSEIKLYTETYTAQRMKEGTEDQDRLKQAQEIVALKNQYKSYNTPQVKAKITEYGFSSYYEASGLVTRANATETGTFDIHAMTIGDVGLVFFPGEMFSTQGTTLKTDSPMAMTFVVTCSEGDQGYFPNEIACEHSYYEYDITKFARGTGEDVVNRYIEIFKALQAGETP